MTKLSIAPTWDKILKDELTAIYMKELFTFINAEQSSGKTIYPPKNEIFSAFKETPFNKTKVIIIGQDPYHGTDQAHGMSFSVKPNVKIPPSLKNIFKELESDLGITQANHGYLKSWAKEGVLLLNSVLTVEESKAGSHHKKGWEKFTDAVIHELNQNRENLVFILWGAPAQKKAAMVDSDRHLILKSPHPSPLAAYRGFFGCKHFSQANSYLKSKGLQEVNWKLPLNPK